jgi:hypothetical protein
LYKISNQRLMKSRGERIELKLKYLQPPDGKVASVPEPNLERITCCRYL